MAYNIINQYLDTNGDGTGTIDAIGDYSSAEEIFYIEPAVTEKFLLTRLIVTVEDGQGMRAERYGALASALTNGITVRVSNDSGVIVSLDGGVPVKANAEWGRLCYDVDVKSWGAGNELLLVRWTFEKTGDVLTIDGGLDHKLEVVLNDDFTGLVHQYFMVQGSRFGSA